MTFAISFGTVLISASKKLTAQHIMTQVVKVWVRRYLLEALWGERFVPEP